MTEMGTNKPLHYAIRIDPDGTKHVMKITTKKWKAWKVLGNPKDYPEGTHLMVESIPPKANTTTMIKLDAEDVKKFARKTIEENKLVFDRLAKL